MASSQSSSSLHSSDQISLKLKSENLYKIPKSFTTQKQLKLSTRNEKVSHDCQCHHRHHRLSKWQSFKRVREKIANHHHWIMSLFLFYLSCLFPLFIWTCFGLFNIVEQLSRFAKEQNYFDYLRNKISLINRESELISRGTE